MSQSRHQLNLGLTILVTELALVITRMSVAVESEAEPDKREVGGEEDGSQEDAVESESVDQAEHIRNDDLESRLAGGGGGSPESVGSQESLSREEKLLEEMLRLKLVGSAGGSASAMLPPKQRIKLYQPRSKLEQFEVQ